MFCVEQWASFLLVFRFLAFRTGVKKLWFVLSWPCAMVQSWYGGWNIWMYTESAWEPHIVLLYEWLQNFETKEPIRSEWCKLLKNARTAYPSATTTLTVAQLPMSFFVCKKTRITRKQYAENISQLYDKNSWGFCQRSIPLKVHDTDLAAQEAHYHSTCRRDYTREDDRHQEPTKDTKTIEEQASNKTICFQYVTGRIV